MANRITTGVILATLAFWAYTRTLLPGVDLGDTAGFQAAVLWPEVSARQAYPLYYTLARPFVAAAGAENPARALNLVSAIWGAVAVGLLVVVGASITRSIGAGAVAGLLLAFSYTFWTQAVIAEVYTLHVTLVALSLLLLHGYAATPTTARLLLFIAACAASFGNHLGTSLLLVPFAIFVLQVTPDRRALLRPGVIAAVAGLAAAGALQYMPNFLATWTSLDAPDTWSERIAAFWFDATKQDWRESMVLGVHPSELPERFAMWVFDARQQFGVPGLAIAMIGAFELWRTARPWAWLLLTAFALNTVFALTYNVGDPHAFFLPGHVVTAVCAGAGVALAARRAGVHGASRPRLAQSCVVLLCLAYAGWRGWATWPLADRHEDRRGEQTIARLAAGVTDRDALLVARMDWQLENVLLYTGRYLRDNLAWVRLGDVMLHWPFLVDDTHRLGRDIVMTADAAADVLAAYGPSPILQDQSAPVVPLAAIAARIPRGTPYVLCILVPPPGYTADPAALDETIASLTDGRIPPRTPAAYEVIAGIAGDPAQVYRSSARPFTMRFQILDEALTLHLDGWLPFETFRRAGFGHVLRGRTRLLTVERGLSLVWVGRDGRPSAQYGAGLFAPQPRYRVPAATLQLAAHQAARADSPPFRPSWDWREP